MAKRKALAGAKGSEVTQSRSTKTVGDVRPSTTLDIGNPLTRPLKAYAFDPSQGRLLGNQMSLAGPLPGARSGPGRARPFCLGWHRHRRLRRDANGVYYKPVDLDDPRILIRGGLDPIESDPRFHQQMVYAVVTETIQHFEAALGRRIHWRRARVDGDDERPTPRGRHLHAEHLPARDGLGERVL